MVNTVGIPQPEVIRALELTASTCLKEEPDSTGYGKHWIGTGPKGETILLFLTDYGFDETPYDEAFGARMAGRAIDYLRAGL